MTTVTITDLTHIAKGTDPKKGSKYTVFVMTIPNIKEKIMAYGWQLYDRANTLLKDKVVTGIKLTDDLSSSKVEVLALSEVLKLIPPHSDVCIMTDSVICLIIASLTLMEDNICIRPTDDADSSTDHNSELMEIIKSMHNIHCSTIKGCNNEHVRSCADMMKAAISAIQDDTTKSSLE